MSNRDLRRLRKTELIELLADQMKSNEWLQKKLEGQETDLKTSNARLEKERQQFAEKTEWLAGKDRLLADKKRQLREMDERITEKKNLLESRLNDRAQEYHGTTCPRCGPV